jgi:iron-sulfur cluster assembly protein
MKSLLALCGYRREQATDDTATFSTFQIEPMAETLTQTAPKAPVMLSAQAASEVQKIMTTKDIPEGYGLRVGVRGGGCSGMSYVLGFDKMREHDVQFDVEGIPVYIDKRHGLYLMGTTIDYHDGLNARGFTFENPNATQTCGCGSSFAA